MELRYLMMAWDWIYREGRVDIYNWSEWEDVPIVDVNQVIVDS